MTGWDAATIEPFVRQLLLRAEVGRHTGSSRRSGYGSKRQPDPRVLDAFRRGRAGDRGQRSAGAARALRDCDAGTVRCVAWLILAGEMLGTLPAGLAAGLAAALLFHDVAEAPKALADQVLELVPG